MRVPILAENLATKIIKTEHGHIVNKKQTFLKMFRVSTS